MWDGHGTDVGRTDGRTDGQTDGWSETNIPPTTSLYNDKRSIRFKLVVVANLASGATSDNEVGTLTTFGFQ